MRIPAALLFCLSLAAAGAQSRVLVTGTTVTPARPYVGDLVECSVTFDPGAARIPEGALDIPPGTGTAEETELRSAEVRKKAGSWVYTARFVAWVPGPARVPVPVSADFLLPEVRVEIASALDDFGRSPPAYKDPLELPGTRLLVWGASGGLLAGATLAWSIAFGLVPWVRRLRRAWKDGRAGRDFGRSLDYLESAAAEFRPEELWALLAKSLREYLAARSLLPYQAFTAREARTVSPETLPPGAAEEAAALLAEGEAVRFARSDPGAGISRALERSREILRSVEEAARDLLR